eukprot:scaffold614_cov367-Prasinococcus_capsulatus_cf.AAC.5
MRRISEESPSSGRAAKSGDRWISDEAPQPLRTRTYLREISHVVTPPAPACQRAPPTRAVAPAPFRLTGPSIIHPPIAPRATRPRLRWAQLVGAGAPRCSRDGAQYISRRPPAVNGSTGARETCLEAGTFLPRPCLPGPASVAPTTTGGGLKNAALAAELQPAETSSRAARAAACGACR